MIVVVAIAWTLGAFLAASETVALEPGWAALAFVCAAGFSIYGVAARARGWAAALAVLALVSAATVAPGVHGRVLGSVIDVSVVGVVASVRYGPDAAWTDIDVLDGRAKDGTRIPAHHRVRLRSSLDAVVPPGSTVRYRGALRPSRPFRNISPHPRWPSTKSFQSRAVLSPNVKLDLVRAPTGRGLLQQAQQAVRRHLRRTLSIDTAGLVRALVLGDGSAITREQRRRVAAAGLAHLLAVSGLHIALLSGACVRLLESMLCRLRGVEDPRRVSACLGIPIALTHALFAGGSPSAWRAAVTASIGWALVAIGRRPSAREVTAGAVIVLCGLDPMLAVRPAFLLSVVATAAIVTARPVPSSRFPALRAANTISWRTLVATTPIVWWCFGEVPLVAWWSNIVLLPIASLVLVPLANLYALSAFAPHLGNVLLPLLEGSTMVFLACCQMLSSALPAFELPPLDVTQAVLVSAGVVAVLVSHRRRLAMATVSVLLLAWLGREALTSAQPAIPELQVTFADIGQGDAALIDLPDGRLMLIDTGPGEYGAAEELVSLLQARRRTRIDIVAITHGHPDHYGALPELLDKFAVGQIWVHGQTLYEAPDGDFSKMVAEARQKGTPVREPFDLCDTPDTASEATIRVLSPCPRYDPTMDLNDNSLIIRIEYQSKTILFTGDAERERERRLVRELEDDLRADVLKVGHHGSKTSSTHRFLQAVSPELAVISAGTGNQFDHPHDQVLRRLRRQGIRTLRTDRDGGISVTISKGALHTATWRSLR